jgi:ABC-type transport system involved in multi-copper enzyme maturation permease subunit
VRADRVWEIAKKDMASVRKHKYVLYGLIGMPLIFVILIPLTSIYPVMSAEVPSAGELPPFAPAGMPYKQAMVLGLVNMTVLMFMILPDFIPSVIASYTFVGEKVNRQLEPLLATPTSDSELLIGKGLGAFMPAMAVTLVSFVGLMLVVDLLTFPLFGYLLLPNLLSVVVLFVYCPLVALLSVSLCVFISSKVTDVRAAMQLSAIAIFPVLAFYFLFLSGVISLDWSTLAVFALVLGLASMGLFYLSKATFRREEILTKWK